jgi:hypothetical protein
MLRRLALAALVLAPLRVTALEAALPGPGWEEANRKDNLVIFIRDNEKANAREVKSITEVDAPPAAVDRALSDFDHFVDFMPAVRQARLVTTVAANEFIMYQELQLPLVDNRDFVIRLRRIPGTPANGGVFRHEWAVTESKDAPPREGIVRIELNTGAWIMEPIDGGKRTRLTYEILTSPGGNVPRWIANKSNSMVIPDVLDAVRHRAVDPAWKKK